MADNKSAGITVEGKVDSPTASPPGSVDLTTETEQDRPRDLSEAELSIVSTQAAEAPTLTPPEVTAAEAAGGITAWQSDKRIGALWTINQVRNSWISITGVGWRRLIHNSDSAVVAMTMLSAHAKQMATRVDYREEADGMIYEIYAW